MSVLKPMAVKVVKPIVGPTTWGRLRAAHAGWERGTVSTPKPVAVKPAAAKPVAVKPVAVKAAAKPKPKTLTELGRRYKTDKANHHKYTQHYERHFQHLRNRPFTMLEIGVGGYGSQVKGGESLRMWKAFFRKAEIVGLDIQDKSWVDEPRITTYVGSQTDRVILEKIVADMGEPTVIIDDGSHRPSHIRATFQILYPLLADGGIYAIEDTQTSYWPERGGSDDRYAPDTTMALVKDLVDGLNYEEYVDESYDPSYTDLNVKAIHAYHNLVIIEKGRNAEGTRRRRALRARYEGAVPVTASDADGS